MDFLVEGLRLSQRNVGGYFRTVEILRRFRFPPIGVPEKWSSDLSFCVDLKNWLVFTKIFFILYQNLWFLNFLMQILVPKQI